MKVKVKDLKPNPYRDMEHYPIDKDKIQSLKDSIEQTGFWDNILAREVDGVIQIAYGHHRLEALKQVMKPTDYVDIPVKDLDDATMIQIMANENMDEWKTSPSVLIETVKVAKQFLDEELSKYETFEEFQKSPLIYKGALFAGVKGDFLHAKKGVGGSTITHFLGKGWEKKQWAVQEALKTLTMINNNEVSEEAIKELPSIHHMQKFTKEVKKDPIPKEKQIKYAKEIKDQDISKREMDDFFADKKYKSPLKKEKEINTKIQKFEDVIASTTNQVDEVTEQLKIILKFKDEFDSEYYQGTIQRLRLIMSLERIQKQISLIIKTTKEDEKSTVGEENPRRLRG